MRVQQVRADHNTRRRHAQQDRENKDVVIIHGGANIAKSRTMFESAIFPAK
jgi:hypothetical protein